MYTVNHPKIRVLFDIAKVFLESLSIKTVSAGILPLDNLVNGPCWPVYPEIGEHYGVGGTYLFKVPGQYYVMSLQEFVKKSLELYSSHPAGAIRATNPRYEQVKAAINV